MVLYSRHYLFLQKTVFSTEVSIYTFTLHVLPKAGLVYSEKGNLSEVLCKPRIVPIKSVELEKLEEKERVAAAALIEETPIREGKTGAITFGGRKKEKVEFSKEILEGPMK
eukprot:GSMAST32.ASY1.ANO1.1630.1 assembled CDS